jgi:hypothetical protein
MVNTDLKGYLKCRRNYQSSRVLARGPRHRASAQQVQMQMRNRLAAVVAGIDDNAVTVFQPLLFRYLSCRHDEATEQRRVCGRCVCQRCMMLFGNDKRMHRRLRVDVRKRQHFFRFIQPRDRDGAGGDFAEEAVRDSRH